MQAAEFCGFLAIDTAITALHELTQDLIHARDEAKREELQSLPGQTVQSCSQQLVTGIKSVEGQKSQLVNAAAEQNSSHAGFIAREMVSSLGTVVQASSGLAAVVQSAEIREGIFSSVLQLLNDAEGLMSASKLLLEQKPNEDMKSKLMEAARKVTDALRKLLNFIPGQAEFEKAIQVLMGASMTIDASKVGCIISRFAVCSVCEAMECS